MFFIDPHGAIVCPLHFLLRHELQTVKTRILNHTPKPLSRPKPCPFPQLPSVPSLQLINLQDAAHAFPLTRLELLFLPWGIWNQGVWVLGFRNKCMLVEGFLIIQTHP